MNDLSTTQLIGLAIAGFTAYLGRDYLAPLLTKLKAMWTTVPLVQGGGDSTVSVDARQRAILSAIEAIDFLDSNGQTDAASCIAGKLPAIARSQDKSPVVSVTYTLGSKGAVNTGHIDPPTAMSVEVPK